MKRLLATVSALGLSISALLAADADPSPVKEAAEKTAETTKKAAEKVADGTKKVAETAKDKTEAAGKATKKAAEKAVDATKEKAAEAKKKVTEKAEKPGELSAADQALVDHAKKSAAKLTPTQKKKLLDLVNTGDDKSVQELPGIGAVKAESVKKARPFKGIEDLILVDGIGEATFDGIVKWAGEPKKPEEKPAPKEEPKEPKKAPAKKG
jgi:DNA uptake protein ComE-like DNA-binding protein